MTVPWEDVTTLPKFEYPRFIPRFSGDHLPFIKVWERFAKKYGDRLKLGKMPAHWEPEEPDETVFPVAAIAFWGEYLNVVPKT